MHASSAKQSNKMSPRPLESYNTDEKCVLNCIVNELGKVASQDESKPPTTYHTVTLRLNRPKQRNALSWDLVSSLVDALAWIKHHSKAIRCVFLESKIKLKIENGNLIECSTMSHVNVSDHKRQWKLNVPN